MVKQSSDILFCSIGQRLQWSWIQRRQTRYKSGRWLHQGRWLLFSDYRKHRRYCDRLFTFRRFSGTLMFIYTFTGSNSVFIVSWIFCLARACCRGSPSVIEKSHPEYLRNKNVHLFTDSVVLMPERRNEVNFSPGFGRRSKSVFGCDMWLCQKSPDSEPEDC